MGDLDSAKTWIVNTMSEHAKPMKVDPDRFLAAASRLQLQTPAGNSASRERLQTFAFEYGLTPAHLMKGLSESSIKTMRRGDAKTPAELPWLLIYFFFKETEIDVTTYQSLATFYALGFDIQLLIDVETRNPENSDRDIHDLKNFDFQIYEAKCTAVDPDDAEFELDLRVGFDRTRLTLRADGIRSNGNKIAGEIPLDPLEDYEQDYKGWFDMRFGSSNPLSWFFDPKTEGRILHGRIFAEQLVRIETVRGSPIVAEITARRDALKVRIVDEVGEQRATKSLADQHRDKMCEAVTRRSFAGAADEFVLHRVPLVASNRKGE